MGASGSGDTRTFTTNSSDILPVFVILAVFCVFCENSFGGWLWVLPGLVTRVHLPQILVIFFLFLCFWWFLVVVSPRGGASRVATIEMPWPRPTVARKMPKTAVG